MVKVNKDHEKPDRASNVVPSKKAQSRDKQKALVMQGCMLPVSFIAIDPIACLREFACLVPVDPVRTPLSEKKSPRISNFPVSEQNCACRPLECVYLDMHGAT